MNTTHRLNALKTTVSRALFGRPIRDQAPPAEPEASPQAERLGELRHLAFPPARLPPEGFVYIEDRKAVAVEDLDEEQLWRRDTIEPLQAEWIVKYLEMADLAARIHEAMDEREARWGARKTKRQQAGRPVSGSAYSLDRSLCLERRYADRVRYDDLKMKRAKDWMEECAEEWEANSRDEIRQLIALSFKKNSRGEYSRAEMARLRKIKSEDQRWKDAVALIVDAEIVDGVAGYLMLSVRDAHDKYHPLPLDIASVRPYRAKPDDGEANNARD